MKTLLIDTRLMAYNRFHRHQDILGLTKDAADLFRRVKPGVKVDKIIFAMDKGRSRRAEKFKAYKAHRRERDSKQTKEYQEALKVFNAEYNKLEQYLLNFGNVVAIDNVEADDIASIMSKSSLANGNGHQLYLMTSDSDWVKFLSSDRAVSVINISKGIEIDMDNVQEVYGLLPEEKLLMDCLVGVTKENVPGLKRFGPVTFKKILAEHEGDLEKVLEAVEGIYDGSDKIPEPFTSVRQMYEFNYELFRPWTFSDLFTEEQELLQNSLLQTPSKSKEKILEDSFSLYGRLYMPSIPEEKFFSLGE